MERRKGDDFNEQTQHKRTRGNFLLSDSIGWGGEPRRNFSVKSAYRVCLGGGDEHLNADWNVISKFRGLPRIRVFLWLLYRGSLLTNSERVRRHLTGDPSCSVCGATLEDVSHLFRHCLEARVIWPRLIRDDKLHEFLYMDFKNWLLLNLRDPNYFPITGMDWDVLFGSILWILWCNRNVRIFSVDTGDPGGVLQRSQRLFEESMRACLPVRRGRLQAPWPMGGNISWSAPPRHWIKINTDGARNNISGLASCGGVGRDDEGNWKFGFSRFLGLCSALEAELWGMFEGLTTAWSLGFTRVIVEVDCRDAYDMITHGNPRQLGSSVLPGLLELYHRRWEVQFRFVRWDGNVPADVMARLAWQGSLGYHRYLEPPSAVRDALLRDVSCPAPVGM
ncbi:hypothetical protein GQ457_04G027620 [Hibiscus cannabinus]